MLSLNELREKLEFAQEEAKEAGEEFAKAQGRTHAITLRSGLSMSSRSVGARRSARLSAAPEVMADKGGARSLAAAGLCRVCATTVSHAA